MGRKGVGRPETREQVWAFLRSYMKASRGRPPTAREIQAGAGLRSPVYVQRALGELESRGLIRRGRFGRIRGIEIVGATYLLPEEAADQERNGEDSL